MEIDVSALQVLPVAEPTGLILCWMTCANNTCGIGTCTHISHTHATDF